MWKNGRLRELASIATGRHPGQAPLYALTVAGTLMVLLMSGCSTQDHVCTSEEYPVKAVGSKTGQACVSKGEEPPKDYVRYPKGKVPDHVDDTWDTYWSTVVVDKHGDVVKK